MQYLKSETSKPISSIFIGNIYGHKDAYAGAVFAVYGLCPAIKANSGGNTQPMIVVKR